MPQIPSGLVLARSASTDEAACRQQRRLFGYPALVATLLPFVPAIVWKMATHTWLYQRGWINVEYLSLLCLALLWPSWRTASLLSIELIVALVQPIAHLYYFHSSDVLASFRYLRFLPAHRLVLYSLLVLAYAAGCAATLRWSVGKIRRPHAVRTVSLIAVCVVAVVAFSFTVRDHRLRARWSVTDIRSNRLLSAPVASLIVEMASSGHESEYGPGPIPLASTLSAAMAQIPNGSEPNVVLVLTESWGLAGDNRINGAERQPYDDPRIQSSYRVSNGFVRFDGATTSGETRALCGNAAGIASFSRPKSYFENCWPAKLARSGYHTVAVHGFTPTMYRRAEWYADFGFTEALFQPQLLQYGGSMCDGAFPGICDADVARVIGERLLGRSSERPLFVHWVTLSSHLPVPEDTNPRDVEGCARAGIVGNNGLCSWFNLVLRLHQSVANLALLPTARPTVFVIVGDHAPPFMRAEDRARFSQTYVPYVILIPRSLAAAAAMQPLSAANEGDSSSMDAHRTSQGQALP